MGLLIRAFFLFGALAFYTVSTSKLNLPRVLLPLFKSSSTNFTLKVTDSGCYKWTLSRLDIIQVIPTNWNKQLRCSSEVILSTITKEFTKNTVIVLVEEVSTKEVLRCDVIVDVISALNIVTKTRQLFVEESPEIFEVRAYDDQGNEFSTLEGIEFLWTVTSGKSTDISGKNDVIRLISFKDSPYEIPKTVQSLDLRGLKGHVVLLEGIKTGTANISVELIQSEYRHVSPATVQLNVIANLIIEPADRYILQGDVAHYKLLQVKNGRFVEVPLPSAQYSLNIENDTVARQFRPWVVEAIAPGQTKLVLSDINSKMSSGDDATYLPSVNLYVVSPAFMNLVLLPHKNWITALHQPNAITAELYDREKHKISIGPHAIITMKVDTKFHIIQSTKNGSYVSGYAQEIGIIHVEAEFSSVRTNDNILIRFDRLAAEADITVYPELTVSPAEVFIPWDPVESFKMNYQLIISGGDGFYQWSIANNQIAIVTQSGILKPRSVGSTEVTASLQKNPAIQASARVNVRSPTHLKIMHNTVESEVGFPVYLAIALYYESESDSHPRHVLFSDCSGFPFEISINNPSFGFNASNSMKTPIDACTTIGIIGGEAGTATVSISYISEGQFLKDVATVSAYQPLKVLTPETGKTVLSVGAQRYVVFVGGPPASDNGGNLIIDSDDSVILVDRIHSSGADVEKVYLITCHSLGESYITSKIINHYAFEGLDPVHSTHRVKVICAHPKSVRLSNDVIDSVSRTCPPSFLGKNMVLNDKPILLKVTILDEHGNVFDNATSLGVKWSSSNTDLGDIRFPGIIKLLDEDRVRYRVPLHHYQIIEPKKKAGNLEVSAKIFNYRKSWLKKLSIDLEDKVFKIGSDLQETITFTLVFGLHLSSESVSIFNHPENVGRVYVTNGSGFYKITSETKDAAIIKYVELSRSIDIIPQLPGTFTLTVKDECLNSEPIAVKVLILTIAEIQIEMVNKIEKGKTTKAFVKLYDSEGNAVTKLELLNLKTELDSNIIDVDCSNIDRAVECIVCMITGVELGHANLVFKAGVETSVTRSAPVRIQIYPPLQLIPRNVTLIPGAVIQVTTKGGPQPECLIEYSVENNVIIVDNGGNVIGNELGEGFVIGKAIGLMANGEKIVYSEDMVRVNVVHLEGIRLKTPLIKMKSGTKMPIWVEGIPEQISPLILASVEPSLTFKWDVSSANVTRISHIFEESGIKVPDSEKISMRIQALSPGRVVVKVKVTAPATTIPVGHRGTFTDSVNIEIFDDLLINNHAYSPILLAPLMTYQLRTNKEKIGHVTYKSLKVDVANAKIFDVNEKGLVSTYNRYGFSYIQVDSIEDNDMSQTTHFPVQVSRVQYMMLNVVPELQVDPESSVFGLPKGIKLQCYITYHDRDGREFTATSNVMKYHLHKIDRVRVSQNLNENNLILDLLDSGISVMKIYDDDSSVFPDYVKINTVPYVQPDKVKLTVGDVVCFHAPAIVKDTHSCFWHTSNEKSLAINRNTGLSVAKSKESYIIISLQCSSNLQIVTTADVYALQKIEILTRSIGNISNNGKKVVVPLVLLNEIDDVGNYQKMYDASENSCMYEIGELHYPYECDIRWSNGGDDIDINSIFKVYPSYDNKYGHGCVIESENVVLPTSVQKEMDVILKVSWSRYHSTKIKIPFKPAIRVQTTTIKITNHESENVVQVIGAPAILSDVQVIPSNAKYVGLVDEETDTKYMVKYSVYLKTAYFKKSQISCSGDEKLYLWIISEKTAQNISIPLYVNVNADQYVPPNYLTEQLLYYANEYLLKIVFTAFIGFILYMCGLKVYTMMYSKLKDDHSFYDMSYNRSHLSDRSNSPPPYSHQKPVYNEIQMIYGRTPERTLRARRNN